MTLGFLLVFFGIQLNVVDSYVLTPRMANFVSDQFPEQPLIDNGAVANPQTGQMAQVGYSPNVTQSATPYRLANPVNRVIRPPGWLGWPIMFLGAVFFLNGLAIRR
jgi:hypothetical protein